MQKIDYKKELKAFYKAPSNRVVEVDVPKMNYLMIDGAGEPGSEAYQQALEALYSVSYTLKFMFKRSDDPLDYGVLPLEGLWWAEDMSDFVTDNKSNWLWTMMIMQPDIIDSEHVDAAIDQVRVKKDPPALQKIRYEAFAEGKAAQIMHIGPFSEEGPTVERVHSFIEDNGSKLSGKHHEIYLSDIRRAASANWKTIIRQPML